MRSILVIAAAIALGLSPKAKAKSHLDEMFEVKKPILAALYIEMPEDLHSARQKREVIRYAKSQMKILEEEGVDAILWEWQAGGIEDPKLTDKQIEVMSSIMRSIVRSTNLVVGFEVLWHYPHATLKIAKNSGAKFVRLDFFSDHMTADGEEVEINPRKILDYRRRIGAENVVLFTDIQVKYAEMIDPDITMTQSARRALRSGSDGVIVSGRESGRPPSANRVRLAKKGAPTSDVIIGSGFSYENAQSLLRYADGVIVGTSISEQTGGPLDRSKVRRLMREIRDLRRNL